MKPSRFHYHAPATVADAIGVLAEHGDEAKVLAGGQSLVPMMSLRLATFALTGFANFSSIGIQIGGIGAMAPSRRADLARLGPRALLAGFLATLVNASLAGALME